MLKKFLWDGWTTRKEINCIYKYFFENQAPAYVNLLFLQETLCFVLVPSLSIYCSNRKPLKLKTSMHHNDVRNKKFPPRIRRQNACAQEKLNFPPKNLKFEKTTNITIFTFFQLPELYLYNLV